MELNRDLIWIMDRKRLGERVQELRRLKELNQKDVARITGVSERSLSDIETGKGNPTLGSLENLETLFKAPILNLAGSKLGFTGAPGVDVLKGIVEDPDRMNPLQLANLLAAQFAEAPAEMRALALRALFDRPELLAPYEKQLRDAAASTLDRKKRLK